MQIVALALWSLCSQQAGQPGLNPNVLLVVIDDNSADDSAPMPNFDRVCATGATYVRMYTNPRCSPSRHSLLFGEAWVTTAGEACDPGAVPFPPLPSIASDFHGSSLLVGKWHLGLHDVAGSSWELSAQLRAGFDDWRAGQSANVNSQVCPPPGTYFDWTRVESGSSFRSSFYETQAVENVTLASIATLPEPWFLMACYQSPHLPFHAPPGSITPPNASDRELYEAMVLDVDESLGVLFDAVDLSKTIFVVVSDNGTPTQVPWAGGPPGNRLKGTTYEGGIRVKAAWAGPRTLPGHVFDELLSFADLRGMIDRRSSVPPERDLVLVGTDFGGVDDLAVVGRRWKYGELDGVPRLHDLEADPGEQVNLAGQPQYAALEACLKARLEAMDPRG